MHQVMQKYNPEFLRKCKIIKKKFASELKLNRVLLFYYENISSTANMYRNKVMALNNVYLMCLLLCVCVCLLYCSKK